MLVENISLKYPKIPFFRCWIIKSTFFHFNLQSWKEYLEKSKKKGAKVEQDQTAAIPVF